MCLPLIHTSKKDPFGEKICIFFYIIKLIPKLTKIYKEIIQELVPLYGIGRWTVEMFLIFHLGRLDVWPVDDLAVRRGWDNLHENSDPIKAKVLNALGEPFTGMRSVVAWYCWRAS